MKSEIVALLVLPYLLLSERFSDFPFCNVATFFTVKTEDVRTFEESFPCTAQDVDDGDRIDFPIERGKGGLRNKLFWENPPA